MAGDGGTRKVNPGEVRAIANGNVATAKDAVEKALQTFRTTPDGDGGFGGSVAAAQLASLHTSVKAVFTDTVSGVTTDLSSYHQNLISAADAWEHSEEASATQSRTLTERLAATAAAPLATADRFNSSRRDQGDSLGLGGELAEHADESLPTEEAEEVTVGPADLPVDPPGVADPNVPTEPTEPRVVVNQPGAGGDQPRTGEPTQGY